MPPAPALLLPAALLLAAQVLAHQGCENGHFTSSGECCDLCPPGYGVTLPCGSSNTKCEPCKENVTFSSVASAAEPCQPCSVCPGHVPMVDSCTPARDTVCAISCPWRHYFHAGNGNHSGGQCLPCQMCPEGYGAVKPCGPSTDTVCQKCPDGYYSEEKSSSEPCLPCRLECGKSEVMIQTCTPLTDILCMDKELQILKRTEGEPRNEFPKRTQLVDLEDGASPNSSSSEFVPPLVDDNSKNIIPVYCSILAAVVVGLLAYVAFKCWSTCRQKQQLAKARVGEPATSPEGEKLHSDSGISVDSQSLHDQPPQTQTASMQGLKGDGNLYVSLPPSKREEVEKLLNSSTEETWRHLAGELGYKEDHIDSFTQEEYPVRALLSDWFSKDSATVDALYSALHKIQRGDIVESLYSESTASSPV